MKDHKAKSVCFYPEHNQPLGDFINSLSKAVADMVDCVIVQSDYDPGDLRITGWVPMTEREIEQAKARRKASALANAAKKAKKEAEERAMYEKLKEKFDVPS
jgi:hypothetical protein